MFQGDINFEILPEGRLLFFFFFSRSAESVSHKEHNPPVRPQRLGGTQGCADNGSQGFWGIVFVPLLPMGSWWNCGCGGRQMLYGGNLVLLLVQEINALNICCFYQLMKSTIK